ncbi:MAG TPA: sigma-70 family RNA polymerase sigma factor [Verrucomicrobiae bacterium]|nr:sigma-70 family RNA polymerase sigma factor [Verrucomicrobiae bacterium]
MSRREHISRSETPPARRQWGGGEFNTTHWSVVLLAGQDGSLEAADALEKLCRTYWYPLYVYCRRQGYGPPDGEDLTQQFFSVFLAKSSFAVATPDRGRFRNFLLASFRHFLANEHHRNRTAKRGGKFSIVSWDEIEPEARYQSEPMVGVTPEKLYEQTWAVTLLGKVAKDLQSEYVASGKGRIFDALHVYLTGDKADLTYEEIGATLQMGESAVKMAVSRLRQRYGLMLRHEIAHTVTDPASVEDELRHLVGVLSS